VRESRGWECKPPAVEPDSDDEVSPEERAEMEDAMRAAAAEIVEKYDSVLRPRQP
jgi:hypothetical protein